MMNVMLRKYSLTAERKGLRILSTKKDKSKIVTNKLAISSGLRPVNWIPLISWISSPT
jgi:hypothetical protein